MVDVDGRITRPGFIHVRAATHGAALAGSVRQFPRTKGSLHSGPIINAPYTLPAHDRYQSASRSPWIHAANGKANPDNRHHFRRIWRLGYPSRLPRWWQHRRTRSAHRSTALQEAGQPRPSCSVSFNSGQEGRRPYEVPPAQRRDCRRFASEPGGGGS